MDKLFGEKSYCADCSQEIGRGKEPGTCCDECEEKQQIESEKKLTCPHDRTIMNKEAVNGIIIDKCPKCGGIYLDHGEIQHLAEEASDGTFATGFILGIAIS